MKPLCWLLVPLLVVLLVLPVLAVEPDDGGEAAPDTSVSETIDDDGITEEPSEPDGPGILDYVISINSYLTYLFGFTVVAFAWWCCSLIYRFLNMFF